MVGKTVKFSVTQEDIDSGIQGDVDDCPVALCMARPLGVPVAVGVSDNSDEIWIWINPASDQSGIRSAPFPIADFVDAFDEFGPNGVHPFDFELEHFTPELCKMIKVIPPFSEETRERLETYCHYHGTSVRDDIVALLAAYDWRGAEIRDRDRRAGVWALVTTTTMIFWTIFCFVCFVSARGPR